MRLQKLTLANFRNYSDAEVLFAPGVNVFIGRNAQGKTNLLEGIALLSTGRSHRGARDAEMVRWGTDAYAVRAQVQKAFGSFELQLRCQSSTVTRAAHKEVYVNGGLVPRLSEVVGNLTTVLFAPADLELVQGSPAARRHYLDLQLSQAGGGYLQALARYNRALLQRNALLRRLRESGERAVGELLAPWDAELATTGGMVAAYRARAVSELLPLAARAHRAISGGVDEVGVEYVSGVRGFPGGRGISAGGEVSAAVQLLANGLAENRLNDLSRAQTTIGPHRDDLRLTINGVDARTYASQGQQRTAALALKLGELEFIRARTGEYPVLLLDDVFSELDARRRAMLLGLLGGDVQKVITATGTEGIRWRDLPEVAFFEVNAGSVSRLNVGAEVESGNLEG